MNLTAPAPDLSIPATLQAEVEKIKNQLTLDEAESIRLRRLIISEEYTITQISNQKQELTTQVTTLKQEFTTALEAKEKITKEVAEAQATLEQLNAQIVERKNELQGLGEDQAQKETELLALQEKLSAREKEQADRETIHAQSVADHQAKKQILAETLNKI